MMSTGAWPHCDRPRERLFANGSASLTDTEVLAIVLRTGVRGVSSLDLARDLLSRYGGLSGVFNAFAKGGASCRGVGPAKIAQLRAGVEVAFFDTPDGTDPGEYATGIPQVLRLMNSPEMNRQSAFLDGLLGASQTPAQALDRLYLATLARHQRSAVVPGGERGAMLVTSVPRQSRVTTLPAIAIRAARPDGSSG